MNIKSTVYPEGYDISKLNTPGDHINDVEFGKWHSFLKRRASLVKEKKDKNKFEIKRTLGFFKIECWKNPSFSLNIKH